MTNIILFGAPGSGKGTQSEKIIEKYGFEHISTGDLFRKEIAQGSDFGRTVKELMDNGQLVPDHLTIELLKNHLSQLSAAKGVIFDGFPRTVNQASELKNLIEAQGNKIDAVINLVVDEQELIARILRRAQSSGRSDDNLETVQKRLATYRNQTEPVLDFCKENGVLVCDIPGVGTIDEIFARVCEAINASF